MPRYAKKTTIKDLENYIHNKYNDNWMDAATEEVPEEDYKILFDFENFDDPKHTEEWANLCDYYEFKDFVVGLCCAGGDWEIPVYFALYIDNKDKLRAYVPTAGNVFNYYTKAAFGSDLDDLEKMPESLIDDETFEPSEEWDGCTSEYDRWREYLTEEEDYGVYNLNDMLQDIESRICVKGNEQYLKPKPKNMNTYEEFVTKYPIGDYSFV